MASSVKVNFAELYRSAFAEPDPQLKQFLLQQVQSLIDTWHFEEQKNGMGVVRASDPHPQLRRIAS